MACCPHLHYALLPLLQKTCPLQSGANGAHALGSQGLAGPGLGAAVKQVAGVLLQAPWRGPTCRGAVRAGASRSPSSSALQEVEWQPGLPELCLLVVVKNL